MAEKNLQGVILGKSRQKAYLCPVDNVVIEYLTPNKERT